ncbi:MAG: GtrA family protein [Candidatus Endonucleobacter bathymodioli]|uniref:GtrA family protein n=1 Tax=Candidatus Endonucleibacter bathymodioli TaxID=539814 RepID=A0AA90NQY6_9GAMM|nr:GtrA family protein [Candidatus Endonucleobacter bathymodioli]
MMHQLIKFVVVGSIAAVVHLGILRWTVEYMTVPPLLGNTMAFIVAFIVSYTGQSLWTFSHKQHAHARTITRFLVTQLLCSFTLNQILFAAFLAFSDLHYMVNSFIVLTIVPLVTYTVSKYWVFK